MYCTCMLYKSGKKISESLPDEAASLTVLIDNDVDGESQILIQRKLYLLHQHGT